MRKVLCTFYYRATGRRCVALDCSILTGSCKIIGASRNLHVHLSVCPSVCMIISHRLCFLSGLCRFVTETSLSSRDHCKPTSCRAQLLLRQTLKTFYFPCHEVVTEVYPTALKYIPSSQHPQKQSLYITSRKDVIEVIDLNHVSGKIDVVNISKSPLKNAHKGTIQSKHLWPQLRNRL